MPYRRILENLLARRYATKRFDPSRPIPPDAEPAPINAYGRSKLAGERAAVAAGALVVRTAWLYGGGGGFLAAILKRAQAPDDRPLRVVTDQRKRVVAQVTAGAALPASGAGEPDRVVLGSLLVPSVRVLELPGSR